MNHQNKIVAVSSLEKVFPDKKPALRQKKYSVFSNERFNFQIACYSKEFINDCTIEIFSALCNVISVKKVELSPSYCSQLKGENDDYIIFQKNDSTVYPDLLREIRNGQETLRPGKWTAFWVTVNDAEEILPSGTYSIEVAVYHGKEKVLFGKSDFELEIIGAVLGEEDLHYTDWFHYDCIAEQHHAAMFSSRYYHILNKYIDCAVKHGMNTLYTPLFTPPLDTEIGGERATAQLVGVEVRNGTYRFDFSKLEFFIANALSRGIKYIELSHLSTQWGGRFCPKIVANVEGRKKNIFGWQTRSDSKEYLTFLDAFLDKLYRLMKSKGWIELLRFHISDEPGLCDLQRIEIIKDRIIAHFPNAVIMDAVYDKEFYEHGINVPVCATSHSRQFCEEKYFKWVYYCSWQRNNYLSNRFFNMPSQRNRIIGIQMYANGVNGLLHWAFNFYNSVLSKYPINPYCITDADGGFESGDSFVVYPSRDGVEESLRLKVLADGFNDYRALKLYEKLTDANSVKKMLAKEGISGFEKYPRSAEWHMNFRLRLNELIKVRLQDSQ